MTSSLNSILTLQRLVAAATFFCACIIIGLFISSYVRVLPSIGMAGVLATGLLAFFLHGKRYMRAAWDFYLPFLGIYAVHLLAGFTTAVANRGEYFKDVGLQLPFLILPLGFWLLPALPARNLRILWLTLLLTAVAAALLSTGNYLLHFDQINEMYLRSKVMPTEPDHIRFSLLVTLAITAGVCLLAHQNIRGWARKAVWGVVLFLAFYQHMLAVRSGLMTLYAVGITALLWLLFKRRQFQQALVLAAGMVFIPAISYLVFPTLQNKSANTREDVGQARHTASANNYSLVGRLYSYRVAMEVVKDNPWIGVSKADMASEMAVRYRHDYPKIRPGSYILPHNQYLYSTVAFGIIGLLVFIVSFYYAGLSVWPRYAPLLLAQYIIVTLSFLVEYTMETQVGLGFCLFFLLLALDGQKPVTHPEPEWRPA